MKDSPLSDHLSSKIRTLSVLSLFGVFLIHSTNLASTDSVVGWDFADFFQRFVAFGVARVSVPAFFLISGFFLFSQFESKGYKILAKKRVHSLLIPYLAWAAAWVVLCLLMSNLTPGILGGQFEKYGVSDFPHIVSRLVYDPIPGQLWFVRDLIFLVLFSPLIWWGLRALGVVFPILLLLGWCLFREAVVISNRTPWEFVSLMSASWFCLGGFFSIKQKEDWFHFESRKWGAILCFVWVVGTALRVWFYGAEEAGTGKLIWDISDRVMIFIGMICLWVGYPYYALLFERLPFEKWSRHHFFVFAAHYPLIGVISALFLKVMGGSSLAQLSVFCFAPVLVYFFTLAIALGMSRLVPQVYRVFNGGR